MNMAVNGQGAPVNTPAAEAASSEAGIDFDSLFTDVESGSPDPNMEVQGTQDSDLATPADGDVALAELAGEQPAAPQQSQQQPQNQDAPSREQLRAAALQQLETTMYNLDDETRRKLVTEPDQVLPKLAAQMHLQVMEQVTSAIPGIVNNLVSQQIEGRLKADRAERDFFNQYPALNKPEYKSIVVESLQMIKQMKPNATGQELAREGAQLAAFRIQQSRGAGQQRQQGAPAPRAPAPQPQRQKPYAPAMQAGRATPPQNMSQDPQDQFWADFDFT
jgi:hypothetical protein